MLLLNRNSRSILSVPKLNNKLLKYQCRGCCVQYHSTTNFLLWNWSIQYSLFGRLRKQKQHDFSSDLHRGKRDRPLFTSSSPLCDLLYLLRSRHQDKTGYSPKEGRIIKKEAVQRERINYESTAFLLTALQSTTTGC